MMTKITEKFVLLVGLDWATRKHDVCIQYPDGKRVNSIIEHNSEVIDNWLQALHAAYPGQIAVAVELSKGPIVYALQKYDFVTIFPINPKMLCRYRRTFALSGAKDDPTDAMFALELMLRYPDVVLPIEPADEKVNKLKFYVEERRRLVDDKKRYCNRLNATLKQYFPQILDWFSHRDTELFMDMIIRWPNLTILKRARPQTVSKFMSSHSSNMKSIAKRLELIKEAKELTDNPTVVETNQLLAMTLARQVLPIIHAIREFDTLIENLFADMPDADLFRSFPGVGKCLAPRLLVALGQDRKRFSSAAEIQRYSGIAPVTERSGKSCWIHWRLQCSRFVRQSFVEWAGKSIKFSFWAEEYYLQQRNKGNNHNSALRSLAFKWIRILYRCWKDKVFYDESKYLKALRERNSPLIV
jgi:transposase